MSLLKTNEIRQKSDAELAKFIAETHSQIATAYVDLKTKEVKQVKTIHNLKRSIARARTIQSERELAALEAQQTQTESTETTEKTS